MLRKVSMFGSCVMATQVVEMGSPDGNLFDGHPDTVEHLVYTDNEHRGFTMRLREKKKPYIRENDFRRKPKEPVSFLK